MSLLLLLASRLRRRPTDVTGPLRATGASGPLRLTFAAAPERITSTEET